MDLYLRYNQVMNSITLKTLRAYCCAKPGAVETYPFDDETLVFKVMGKMFALTNIKSADLSVNLKCDPEKAIEKRILNELMVLERTNLFVH